MEVVWPVGAGSARKIDLGVRLSGTPGASPRGGTAHEDITLAKGQAKCFSHVAVPWSSGTRRGGRAEKLFA